MSGAFASMVATLAAPGGSELPCSPASESASAALCVGAKLVAYRAAMCKRGRKLVARPVLATFNYMGTAYTVRLEVRSPSGRMLRIAVFEALTVRFICAGRPAQLASQALPEFPSVLEAGMTGFELSRLAGVDVPGLLYWAAHVAIDRLASRAIVVAFDGRHTPELIDALDDDPDSPGSDAQFKARLVADRKTDRLSLRVESQEGVPYVCSSMPTRLDVLDLDHEPGKPWAVEREKKPGELDDIPA